jgi:GH18 family chitinase
MRYIREHGLAGAMAWQLGGDHPQESLLQVMSGLSQKAYP